MVRESMTVIARDPIRNLLSFRPLLERRFTPRAPPSSLVNHPYERVVARRQSLFSR